MTRRRLRFLAHTARIYDQDEAGQTFNMMTGPKLIWNRKTNHVDAPGASIQNSPLVARRRAVAKLFFSGRLPLHSDRE